MKTKYLVIFDENERPYFTLNGNDNLFSKILKNNPNSFEFYEIYSEKEFNELV